MQKDSVLGTLVVAGLLCGVCSVLVSSAAVGLRERQEFNKKLDVKKNLLLSAGLIDKSVRTPEAITEAFSKIKVEMIDLETGETTDAVDPESFDLVNASRDSKIAQKIEPEHDKAGVKARAKYYPVYKVLKDDQVDMIILPVSGKGLWSTMHGFLAITPDTKTVKGIGFYQHGETPGLGGEIENTRWQESWQGKKIFDSKWQPALSVIKGTVTPTDPAAAYKIDGLSGATITANGVTGMVHYWLGEQAFGPYLERQREMNL
jgi:Na+-transporting NADH:ubiquinone oxidoreductase subunit C